MLELPPLLPMYNVSLCSSKYKPIGTSAYYRERERERETTTHIVQPQPVVVGDSEYNRSHESMLEACAVSIP
jgi:hypothetical protein